MIQMEGSEVIDGETVYLANYTQVQVDPLAMEEGDACVICGLVYKKSQLRYFNGKAYCTVRHNCARDLNAKGPGSLIVR